MSENAIKSIAQDFKSLLIKSQKEIQGKTKRQNNMLQSLKQVKQNIKKKSNENQHLKKRTTTATEAQQTTVTTYSTTQKTFEI